MDVQGGKGQFSKLFVGRFSLFLLPSVFQMVIYFVTLPVITYILDPKDFGVIALITAFTAFGSTISTMGSCYVLAAHFTELDIQQKKNMVSTILAFGFLTSVLFSCLFIVAWEFLLKNIAQFSMLPLAGIILSLLSMTVSIPWLVSIEVITLEQRVKVYAFVSVLQSVISVCASIVCLYVFRWGVVSIFAGTALSSLVGLAGASVALKNYLVVGFNKRWMKEILSLSGVTMIGNILENMQMLTERYVLSFYAGLSQLGIYAHSQQYKNATGVLINSLGRTVWPITLSEARTKDGGFPVTEKSWKIAYLGLTIIGVFFALLGKEFIGLLTHGKFSSAYFFVALWMIHLLIANAGKPETGILYAHGKGILVGKITIVSTVTGMALIFVLGKMVGVLGVLTAIMLQQTVFRVLIQINTRKDLKVLLREWPVLYGIVLIAMTLWLSFFPQLQIFEKSLILAVLTGLTGFLSRRAIAGYFVNIFDIFSFGKT